MKYLRLFFFLSLISFFSFAQNHLLITEIVVTPTEGEFVEIHNPINNVIDLSDYYLTDATFENGGSYYYNIVTGQNAGGGTFGDFHARFPDGASIGPGEFQTMAMNGTDFIATYGNPPTYELWDTDSGVSDMREALPGLINDQGGLTNSGEVVILYHWDGQSDLVDDVDYLVYGDKAEAVDKTGVSIDGPDPGPDPSTYLDDTAIPQQISASPGQPHDIGESIQRLTLTENGETLSGGNGINGHDETSEDLTASFPVGAPNPGSGPGGGGGPAISNVSINPANPTASDEVTVSADVSDDGMVISVKLFYSVSGGPADSTDMTPVGGDTYQGAIPPQPGGSVVQYSIKAEDDEGNISNSPNFSYTIVGITPIADIQANPSAFNVVTIQGVVTLGAGVTITTRTDAYVQDGSGRGINIFSFDAPDPLLVRGNEVRITGTVEEFQGVTEITNYTSQLVSTGNPIPDPLALSTQQANNTGLEGTYIGVKGVITGIGVVASGTNINVDDGSGEVLVRVWDITGIVISALNEGDSLEVRAVMDIFENESQLIPGYQDEIGIPGTHPADGSGIAIASPEVVAALDTLQEFSVSIIGVLEEPVKTVRIDIPKLWQWSENEADINFSGSGLENIFPEIVLEPLDSVYQVYLSDTEITLNDTAVITFRNLVSAPEPLKSVFWIATAGDGGRLTLINDMPVVTVAGGTRHLIYDLQTSSSHFSGTVETRGVTTIGAGILREVSSGGDSLTTAYVQDESGRGVNLFRFGLIQPELRRGNLVEVYGAVTEFNGVTEIEYTQINLISTGAELPQAISLSNAGVNSTRWDGTLIATAGIILEKFSAGGGTTLEISDGKGTTNIRIWDTARLDLSGFNENDRIFVEGVGGLFIDDGDSIFQILPAYQDQIELDPTYVPQLDNAALRVDPHPFAPDQGEKIAITYNAAAVNNKITVRIFDLGGRLITTLLDEQAQLIESTFRWDGRDRLNERVPLGTYICHLEVIEPVSGKKITKTAPIVVGTILSR